MSISTDYTSTKRFDQAMTGLDDAVRTLDQSVKLQHQTSQTMSQLNTIAEQSDSMSVTIDHAVDKLIVEKILHSDHDVLSTRL